MSAPRLQVLEGGAPDPLGQARELSEQMLAFVLTQAQEATREGRWMDHSDMEVELEERGREFMRQVMQGWLTLMAPAEAKEAVVDAKGEERTQKRTQTRPLETIFGEVKVARVGYGAEGKESLHPLDAHLNLPEEIYSLEVRRRAAEEVAKNSFGEARKTLERYTGAEVPKRQLEELAQRAACDFDAFYEGRRQEGEGAPAPAPGSLLVITSDAKGVVLREEDLRPATRQAAERERAKLSPPLGEASKLHRKRMATVASVYTVAPYVRTPEQVLRALAYKERGPSPRPRPQHKRVWASLEKEPFAVLEEAFQDASDRDVHRQLTRVAVVDGNEHQLANLRKLARRYGVRLIIILDLYHVLPYVWKAGYALAGVAVPRGKADDEQAEDDGKKEEEKEKRRAVRHWVLERIGRILKGQASQVAAGMRRSATKRKKRRLSSTQRKTVDVCANYLLKYKSYLAYDQYLAAGLPIASGVIEGACRHLVKDRLALTGARWRLPGAEAVLRLRSLRASQDFDDYWRFHKAMEYERNHPPLYANRQVPAITDPSSARLHSLK